MAEEKSGWHPPNANELLEKAIENGSQWYELRLPLKTISFPISEWDTALRDAKEFRRVLRGKAALYFCYKTDGVLHAELVL